MFVNQSSFKYIIIDCYISDVGTAVETKRDAICSTMNCQQHLAVTNNLCQTLGYVVLLQGSEAHYNDVIMSAMASQITSFHDCLLNHLFGIRSKKTSKLRITGLCAGNSPGTGEFPAPRASNAENVSIWWRHHVTHSMLRWTLECHMEFMWNRPSNILI